MVIQAEHWNIPHALYLIELTQRLYSITSTARPIKMVLLNHRDADDIDCLN